MSIKPSQSKYDTLGETPLNNSRYNQTVTDNTVSPPPPYSFMITEVTEDIMIAESGDFMITEN